MEQPEQTNLKFPLLKIGIAKLEFEGHSLVKKIVAKTGVIEIERLTKNADPV
jgi:hypothetical protein